MKTMKRRGLALLMALTMLLSALPGAFATEPTTVATAEPTVVATSEPTAEPTATATTEAPTTEAPTTEAPTTEAPTTEAPTTEATATATAEPAQPAKSAMTNVKNLFYAVLADYFSGRSDENTIADIVSSMDDDLKYKCAAQLDEAMDAYDALTDEEMEQFDEENYELIALMYEVSDALTGDVETMATTPTAELTVSSISVKPGETSETGTLTLTGATARDKLKVSYDGDSMYETISFGSSNLQYDILGMGILYLDDQGDGSWEYYFVADRSATNGDTESFTFSAVNRNEEEGNSVTLTVTIRTASSTTPTVTMTSSADTVTVGDTITGTATFSDVTDDMIQQIYEEYSDGMTSSLTIDSTTDGLHWSSEYGTGTVTATDDGTYSYTYKPTGVYYDQSTGTYKPLTSTVTDKIGFRVKDKNGDVVAYKLLTITINPASSTAPTVTISDPSVTLPPNTYSSTGSTLTLSDATSNTKLEVSYTDYYGNEKTETVPPSDRS